MPSFFFFFFIQHRKKKSFSVFFVKFFFLLYMDHSIQFLVKIQFLHLNYLVLEQLILNDHLLYKIKGSCHFSPIHRRLFSFFLTKSRSTISYGMLMIFPFPLTQTLSCMGAQI
jgi:hypothetical protein